MKYLGGTYQRDKKASARRRGGRDSRELRSARDNERIGSVRDVRQEVDSFRVGRAIAGDARRNTQEKLERLEDRKKQKWRNAGILAALALLVAIIIYSCVNFYMQEQERKAAERESTQLPTEPTVKIIDENVGENISSRVKEFVARLEDDVKDYNLKIEKIVLPAQMAREVDVYLEGKGEHYKMNLDRDTAVQAEDMHRMMLYLEEKEIECNYVDLRIEGKAYYM